MTRGSTLIIAGLVAVQAMLPAGSARAAEEPSPIRPAIEGQGPFSQRNQFLFNLLFFAFPQRGGAVLPPRTSEVHVDLDYANTFVGSDVFTSFETAERTRLTLADLDAAQASQPGDDLFFVDMEQARTTLTFRQGVSRRIEADLEVPFISYLGGGFDPVIEWYHRTTGLGNAGREFYEQNIVQLALTLGNDRYFADKSPSAFQLGDVSVVGRFRLFESLRGAMAVSAGWKFPTGEAQTLGGSGSPDQGLDLEWTLRWEHQFLHLSSGWVHTGKWALFPDFHPADEWSFGASYEYARNARLSWIGQVQTQSSVFRGRAHDGSLADYSTEILAGARWLGPAGEWSFQTALIENIVNPNNGVDIGIFAGFGVRLGGAGSSPAGAKATP